MLSVELTNWRASTNIEINTQHTLTNIVQGNHSQGGGGSTSNGIGQVIGGFS